MILFYNSTILFYNSTMNLPLEKQPNKNYKQDVEYVTKQSHFLL